MGHKRKGHILTSKEYAKHLRPDGKRKYWGQERQAGRREAVVQNKEMLK